MATPRKIHQDKWVVFLWLVNILLTLFSILLVLFSIDTERSIKIVRYKTSLGPAGFESGPTSQLYSFILMAIIIGVAAIVLSKKVYPLRRNLALLVIVLSIVAHLFNLVVSNSLLSLP